MPDLETRMALHAVEHAIDRVEIKWSRKGGAESAFAVELLADISNALSHVRLGVEPDET